MDQKKTGQFLKTLRNEKGITQEQLAKHFNVSNRSVSRWETGTNLPDISLLVEIADFYDVDVREIIDGERKSEMMDQETREVAGKMAVYAGNEKSTLLRVVQIAGIIGIGISIIAIVLQTLTYEPDLRRSGAIFASFIAFVIMCVITLYVTGLLKKLSKNRKAVIALRVIIFVILGIVTHYLLVGGLAILVFSASMLSAKVEVSSDIAEYNKYIHNGPSASGGYGMGEWDIFDVFPETVGSNAEAVEYQLTYYNPWDAQYIVYMTLDYKAGYDEEIARLNAVGVEEYTGLYSVTGAPEGYELVAMDSDDYCGFCYAMIPEDSAGNTKITYVGIVFCNYFLDVDVHKYLPDRYLLKGFDATDDNPYREKMLGE